MSTSTPQPDPPPTATGQVPLREMLRDRAFSLYLFGQTTSGAGSALSSVALVFAVLSISRSAGSVGLVLLAACLPGIALSLAGGIVADRRSRRAPAVTADAIRTASQAITYAVHETAINILVLSPFFVLGPVIAKAHLGGAPAWSAVALG